MEVIPYALPVNCLSTFSHLPDSVQMTAAGYIMNPDNIKGVGQFVCPNGYVSVKLGQKKMEYAHRLVAKLFIPRTKFEKKDVHHKNRNRKDNRLENLEWLTHRENLLLRGPYKKRKKIVIVD